MSLQSLLNQTCDIYRKTETISTSTGFVKTTFPQTYTSVPCRVQAKTGYSGNNAGSERFTTKYVGFWNIGTDVKLEDRISVTDDPSNITGYTVKSAPMDESGQRVFIVADLEAVQGKGGVT